MDRYFFDQYVANKTLHFIIITLAYDVKHQLGINQSQGL